VKVKTKNKWEGTPAIGVEKFKFLVSKRNDVEGRTVRYIRGDFVVAGP
jgi:hypothetical protein